MKSIHDPTQIGRIELRNRIVRSATAEMKSDGEGRLTEGYLPIFDSLAKGGVGLIITGMMGVNEKAKFGQGTANACYDGFVQDLHKIAERVHALDGRVMVQLVHSGAKAMLKEEEGQPLGPSDMTLAPARPARAMTKAEIADLAEDFAEAAVRCKEAGVDGVQIHGAHGYLISQFLSPSTNKRTDEYGGEIANRGRIAIEILEAMRRKTGDDFPLWIKINCKDLVEESITLEECVWLCGELEKRGLDAIELSAGMGYGRDSSPSKRIANEDEEGSFAPEALILADKVGIPVISTGGFRTPAVIEQWLNKGGITGIGLSRPLICEPNLVNRWKAGDPGKTQCISCSRCYRPKNGYGCQVSST
ncbi:MAG: NADH:flavin oxidoreductase [Clostridiales bacterium]|nr:NADH:flavin oxidoreductase [Clostridiales bacterium]